MDLDWIEEGEGASESDIVEAEQRLGVAFPPSFRKLLARHAGGDCEPLEVMTMPEDIAPASKLDIAEFACVAGWSEARLERIFPVFSSASGSYYALDYSHGPYPSVLDLDHEQSEGEPHSWPSWKEFLDS